MEGGQVSICEAHEIEVCGCDDGIHLTECCGEFAKDIASGCYPLPSLSLSFSLLTEMHLYT